MPSLAQLSPDVDRPLVSVAMPTYNRAARLRTAFSVVVGQSYPKLEIILADNASTDDTAEFCRTALASDDRVRVYRHASNIGPVANFEFARAQASGKYFMWLADDDTLSENYIASCVARLESDPDLVLVAGAATYLHADGTGIEEAAFALEQPSPLRRVLAYFSRVSQNAVFYGVYRREAVAHCRMPNMLGGDWAWLAEVAVEGKIGLEPRAKIRRSSAGTSASYRRILEVIGAPRWTHRWPRLVLAFGLAAHVAAASPIFRARYPIARLPLAFLVVAILCYRLIAKPVLGRCLARMRAVTGLRGARR